MDSKLNPKLIGNYNNNITGKVIAVNSNGELEYTSADTLVHIFSTMPVASQTYFKNVVQDYDGNWYDAVIIGEQVWLVQHLRTTHYTNGHEIDFTDDYEDSEDPKWTFPDNDDTSPIEYGYLYNWHAVIGDDAPSSDNPSGVQGIAPDGWHIPSSGEWNQLIDYLASSDKYYYTDSSYTAKAVASRKYWERLLGDYNEPDDESPYECPERNNATGLNLTPAGATNNHYATGSCCYCWTSDETPQAYYITFEHQQILSEDRSDISDYCSVRCVCDMSATEFLESLQKPENEQMLSYDTNIDDVVTKPVPFDLDIKYIEHDVNEPLFVDFSNVNKRCAVFVVLVDPYGTEITSINLNIYSSNWFENYVWIINTLGADADIFINYIRDANANDSSHYRMIVAMPDTMTLQSGCTMELGVWCVDITGLDNQGTLDGYESFVSITERTDLATVFHPIN